MSNENQRAAVLGAIAEAKHIYNLAEAYGVAVILHTDHCVKKLLPWIDGLLDTSEEFYKQNGKSLYSSHMLDFLEEPIVENLEISAKYFERMNKIAWCHTGICVQKKLLLQIACWVNSSCFFISFISQIIVM